MAAIAEREYVDRFTSGSAAYDLGYVRRPAGTFVDVPLVIPEKRVEEEVLARPETDGHARRAREAAKHRVSPLAVMGFLVAAALMVMTLMARVQLTELTASASALNSQIQQLETEEEHLRVKYESTFNLTEVEKYATKTLGMVRVSDDNVINLHMGQADKAVILSDNGNAVSSLIAELSEYFA